MRPMVTVYAPGRNPRQVINVRLSVQLSDPAVSFGYCSIKAPVPRMRDIAAEVADRHGIRLEEMRGDSRCRHFVRARQEAMWLVRQVKTEDGRHRFSLPFIGQYMGQRDHSTVLHGVRAHQKRLDQAADSRREWVAVA